MTSEHALLLIVDADPQIVDVVSRFARRAGVDVVACADGRQALEPRRCRPADLAMVDLRMPDVNGLDVLGAIRETLPGCAVMLVTGCNVRELRNVVERACILAEGDPISGKDPAVGQAPRDPAPPACAEAFVQVPGERPPGHPEPGQESLATIERDHIVRTLRRAGGNKKAAAKMLGLSRRALYRRLERHRLDQTIARRKPARVSAGD
jgi:DNA-binding NtrC family response regulator